MLVLCDLAARAEGAAHVWRLSTEEASRDYLRLALGSDERDLLVRVVSLLVSLHQGRDAPGELRAMVGADNPLVRFLQQYWRRGW
jgi:hypothetical protein